jgi:hypothetical protein
MMPSFGGSFRGGWGSGRRRTSPSSVEYTRRLLDTPGS